MRIGSRVESGVVRKRFEEKTSEIDERAARGWLTESNSSHRCREGRENKDEGGRVRRVSDSVAW